MKFRDVSEKLRMLAKLSAYLGLALMMTACFKNPGSEQVPLTGSSVPIDPVYNSANNSYLWAHGPCNGIASFTFTYSSSMTNSNTVSAACKQDKISVYLPIQYGDLPQTFKVSIVGKIGMKTAPAVVVTVNYAPTPPLTPGYAVLSGGGISSGSYTMINSSIGEVLGNPTLTAPGILLRTGVDGINDP